MGKKRGGGRGGGGVGAGGLRGAHLEGMLQGSWGSGLVHFDYNVLPIDQLHTSKWTQLISSTSKKPQVSKMWCRAQNVIAT